MNHYVWRRFAGDYWPFARRPIPTECGTLFESHRRTVWKPSPSHEKNTLFSRHIKIHCDLPPVMEIGGQHYPRETDVTVGLDQSAGHVQSVEEYKCSCRIDRRQRVFVSRTIPKRIRRMFDWPALTESTGFRGFGQNSNHPRKRVLDAILCRTRPLVTDLLTRNRHFG